MRGLLLTAAVFAICFVAFAAPFAGLLGWGWFTLFAPHQLAWGGVAGISFNDLIAAVTIFGWIFAAAVYGERLLPPNLPISWLFVLFAIWLIVSQLFALAPELSYPNFERFIIVMVFILLCSALITDKIRIQSMIWVLVLSLALYSIKGALFTIATGGGYHVYGPGRTVIGDNNHFGIAIESILTIII